MEYIAAIEFIQSTMKFGSKLGLENMNKLLEKLDHPQEKLRIIHVAGTNGKGSTCSFINSILTEAGYRVGLYTSPSIEGFTGRIRINNYNISEDRFADLTSRVRDVINVMVLEGMDHPTEFEIITAMAFLYFQVEKVDFVVLEVGLGGRLDATNVVKNPLISVITPIGLDHTEYLGDTLGKIAFEKAGIIKENNLVVSAKQDEEATEVIKSVALKNRSSDVMFLDLSTLQIQESEIHNQRFSVEILDEKYRDINIRLIGLHQIENACLALAVIQLLRQKRHINIDRDSIYLGLAKTQWPGRFEIVSSDPMTIIDGAHNVHAALRLKETIEKVIPNKSIVLVIGMLGDKDVDGVLNNIVPLSKKVVITQPNNSRALLASDLEKRVKRLNENTYRSKSIEDAVSMAYELCQNEEIILFAGSLYLIEKVRALLIKSSDSI